jgi:peptidoglycan/LPS O-acetylase OafA/YrhL
MVHFKLGYRSELDGIRGISILLVLGHHFVPSFIRGGFLGVDIFFVLSGFLITSLLTEEHDAFGFINLRRFYVRRVLRLLPALFAMLILVCAYVWLFQDAERSGAAFQGAALSVGYVSNWIQAFRRDVAIGPFGITWSLAIEEQFYMLWPILLWLALASLNRSRRKWLLSVLGASILMIGIWRAGLFLGGSSIWRLYYGSDTRSDALLTGCLASLLLSWGFLTKTSRLRRPFLTLAIVSLIGMTIEVAIAHPTDDWLYAGGATVRSLMLGVTLISLCLWCPPILISVLRCRSLVWFGRISYGLYLWHWPVFLLTNPGLGIRSVPARLTAAVLAIGLAAISFYVVEKPSLALKKRFAPDRGAMADTRCVVRTA